jgi:Flp pilus assembly protein TadD
MMLVAGFAAEGYGVPPSATDALRQARAALTAGRLEEALEACRSAVRLNPMSASAYSLLGMIQIRRGDTAEARQALLQSLKLDPARAGPHRDLGNIYLSAGELPAAAQEFETAIKLGDPSGMAHYGLGSVLLAEAHVVEALPYLLAAVQANSQDSVRLFTLMSAELQLKQVGSAQKHLALIRQRFPRDPAVAYRAGKILLDYDLVEAEVEFDRAAALLASAAGKQPPADLNVTELYLQLARLRFGHNDYWDTLRYLERIDPKLVPPSLQASALHLEGQALVGVGRAQEALGRLSQAAQKNPSNPEFVVHLSWANFLAGNLKAAASAAEFAAGKWPNVPDVQLMLTIQKRESTPEREQVPLSEEWHMQGEGLVCCPCKVPCPCRSNAPPTYGHCENAGLIHVRQGHYGKVSLAGLSFVTLNGTMSRTSAPSAVYVDHSATDAQIIALERLTQSLDPLRPAALMNVERVPIWYRKSEDGKTYEVEIPGVVRLKVRRQLDSQGHPAYRTAALDDFSNVLEYANNLTYVVWNKDGSPKWDFSGRQANFRLVDVDSADYKLGKMLKQFADGSGYFNARQLKLIEELRLPVLSSYPRPTE